MSREELIKLVLESFEAEKEGNSEKGLSLVDDAFKVTEMFLVKDKPFVSISGEKIRESIKSIYKIKGREYIFKNIAADEKKEVVFVEFIESYADPETGKVYRTPQVAVIAVKSGKLYRTRHYTDPRLSYKYLSEEEVDKAFE